MNHKSHLELFFISLLSLSAFLLISSCSPKNSDVDNNGNQLKNMRDDLLEKHNFARDDLDTARVELLAGNGEMGGLVAHDGLGFDMIWCSDLWENKEFRTPLEGLKLSFDEIDSSLIDHYSQKQALKDGIVKTIISHENGDAYEAEIFFHASNTRLMVIRVKNLSNSRTLNGKLHVPEARYQYASSWPEYDIEVSDFAMFNIDRISKFQLSGISHDSLFTKSAWNLQSNILLDDTAIRNQFELSIEPDHELHLYFSFVTDWQAENYVELSRDLIKEDTKFSELKHQHMEQWASDWAVTPCLILPDKQHEELFYRSAFWLFSTSGSEHFLPGEAHFATTCWNMKPFTYGAAGWSTLAFMHLGHFEKAKKMLINHYKPEGLKQNVKRYIDDISKGQLAYSFCS